MWGLDMKEKKVFVCTECGRKASKWSGRCTECGAWNTLEEITENVNTQSPSKIHTLSSSERAVPFSELSLPEYIRIKTGMSELDRVLGGGLVAGSCVLISGEPGIGKSTLLMQISDIFCREKKVLYVSGEESSGQLKLRAERLGVSGSKLFILIETNVEKILDEIERISPDIVIVDSVQTMYSSAVNSAPSSITQVRECAMAFISCAKKKDISVLLVGHVNKEGGIAGPKVLEHMVDAVIYFEGERHQSYRLIRATKNRYGATNEIGVFEMTDKGLSEVENPSEMLLAGRPQNASGNCAVCTIEGTRPLIAEIQALATTTTFPVSRRTSNGYDYNRLCLILAVLEKKLGLKFSSNDIYINVIGGLRLTEPGTDLGLACALISSYLDKPLDDDVIALGELGLSGEIRAVTNAEIRIKEAAKLGFSKIILPKKCIEGKKSPEGITLYGVSTIADALKILGKK